MRWCFNSYVLRDCHCLPAYPLCLPVCPEKEKGEREGKGSEPRLGIDVRRMTAQGCAAYVRKAIAVDSLEPGESDAAAAAALAGAVAALASFAVVVFNLCGPEARRK